MFVVSQESVKALLRMRQSVKEKELEALLAGEHDSCSCYIEVSFVYYVQIQKTFVAYKKKKKTSMGILDISPIDRVFTHWLLS